MLLYLIYLNIPLKGTKLLDFLSFSEAVDFFNSDKHRTEEGFNRLIEISNSMNSYRKYPSVIGEDYNMGIGEEYVELNGHYINGFIAGDGALSLRTGEKNFPQMVLQISQHVNNKALIASIGHYFNSASKIYKHGPNSIQLTLTGLKL